MTDREIDVLKPIAWGYSYPEVARRLDISMKTVEFYRACAVRKLKIGKRSEIVRYAVQHGWLGKAGVPAQ